ncbi:hypothetical protein SUNI508_13843 [Seiridium unicorne]|uniref:Uncharacterized protein n=1 Tax=Seiridium unicorne TaxID=138068 RepID=A0ABR2VAX2_9PEZI
MSSYSSTKPGEEPENPDNTKATEVRLRLLPIIRESAQIWSQRAWDDGLLLRRPEPFAFWTPTLVAGSVAVTGCLEDYGATLAASTQLPNDLKLSPDGFTLFLNGARLGSIEKKFVPVEQSTHLWSEDETNSDHVLRFVEAKIAHNYLRPDRSPPAAFANASTGGACRHSPLEFQNLMLGLCYSLVHEIQEALNEDIKPTAKEPPSMSAKVVAPTLQFEKMREARKRREGEIQKQLEDPKSKASCGIDNMDRYIQDLEGQIGKRDGWALIGKAYVEGIMDGEAVAEYSDRFERLSIC